MVIIYDLDPSTLYSCRCAAPPPLVTIPLSSTDPPRSLSTRLSLTTGLREGNRIESYSSQRRTLQISEQFGIDTLCTLLL
ncbi:hypothetical protein J6590_002124, partial [Homalodisca vitripennis]